MQKIITSPIRWSGSKRKIVKYILPYIDNKRKIYVEPFLGSATMLINILSEKRYDEYYVNDFNPDLVLFFQILQREDKIESFSGQISDLCAIYNSLYDIEAKKKFFYTIRSLYNEAKVSDETRASFFWFLTKTCFNGVYRINLKGEYNVPFGKKKQINIDIDQLLALSESLREVTFFNMDYMDFMKYLANNSILSDSFIYLDPPYIPETKISQNQKMYTINFFEHDRYIDFINVIGQTEKTSLMLSMSDSSYSKKIYGKLNLNKTKITDIKRVVNPKAMTKSTEVIYTNYLF